MQISVENISNIEKKISISIEKKILSQKIDKKLKQIALKSKIPGFRPGKAPLNFIQQRYAANIQIESIEELVNETMHQALTEKNLVPVTNPDININHNEKSDDFKYTATFEVYPEVNFENFKNLNIKEIHGEIKEDDVDKMIDSLRKQHTHYHSSDKKTAELDDRVTINFIGKLDGVGFEGGKAENHPLVLGSKTMIPGFEESIVGGNINESFSFKVTFPNDYQAENLKGKETEFEILITKIETPHTPELNKSFWEKFGVQSEKVEDFKKEVKTNMERELTRAKQILIKQNALRALSEANEIEVPKKLVSIEIQDMKRQVTEKYKMDMKNASTLPDDMFEKEALEKVKLRILVSKIVENKKITATKEEVEVVLNDMAANYQDPEQLIQYYKSNKNLYRNLENITLENKLVDFILSEAQKTIQTLSYKEIVQLAHQ